MATTKQRWQYPTIDTNENKRFARVGTPLSSAHETIGFDGTEDGGLRPFSGFIKVHTLDSPTGVGPVVWLRAFDLRVGDDKFAYGFIYRTTLAGLDNIYVEWRVGTGSFTRTTLAENVPNNNQCDFTTFGRLLYVYIKGRPCVRFWIEDTSPSPTTHVLGGPGSDVYPGPGSRPVLIDADKVGTSPFGSWCTLADRLADSTYNAVPGYGGIHLVASGPSSVTNIPLTSGGWSSGAWGSGYGTGSIISGGDPDGTWADGSNPQRDDDVRQLEPGDYAFAYQLVDSQTGTKSSLSKIAVANSANFNTVSGSTTTANYLYAALAIVYDSSKWDTAIIYRSVRNQDAGGVLASATLWRENTITLADYLYGRQGNEPNAEFTTADADGNIIETTDARRALYFYEADDKALVSAEAFLDDRTTYDEFPPTGGSCLASERTLFVSAISRWSEDTLKLNPAIGEIRWSSSYDGQPELFQQVNTYIPPQVNNEVIKFCPVNGNIIGFSKDRLYMLRKESVYVKAQEMHAGFGLTNPNSATEVAGTVYYLNSRGILTVDSDGKLDSVDSVNSIINKEWENLSYVHMAFDPYISALFVVNPYWRANASPSTSPGEGRAIVFWFRTQKVRELYDVNFLSACTGLWPRNPIIASDDLVQRGLFLDAYGNVYVVDADRQKAHQTLLDPDGSARWSFVAAATDQVQATDGTVGTASRYKGCRLYVLSGPNQGRSALITDLTSITGDALFTVDDLEPFTDLEEGTRLGVSPVYCRWTGHHLLKYAADGSPVPFDFFQRRVANTLGCSFSDAAGNALGAPEATFRALIYSGNGSEPVATAVPRNRGNTQVASIVDREGTYYAGFTQSDSSQDVKTGVSGAALFPSVEIACPDLDFRLLSVVVTGTINNETTSQDIAP